MKKGIREKVEKHTSSGAHNSLLPSQAGQVQLDRKEWLVSQL